MLLNVLCMLRAVLLKKVNEERSMLNTIRQRKVRKHRWLEHVLRSVVFVARIIEGGMENKAFCLRKRLHN